ncbi:MAG: hypothetical protein NC311_10605 [Muribaculaceae bacterium]|nr:hypothetical protein [Muribaculaceae bacterium]
MAGADNLKPIRTKKEAQELGRKGGIASGKARRKKRAMKSLLNDMLASPAPAEKKAALKNLGVDEDDETWQAVVMAALIDKACKGNTNAIQLLTQLSGDDPYLKARQAEVRVKREELKLRERQIAEEQANTEDLGAQIDQAFEYDAAREDYP